MSHSRASIEIARPAADVFPWLLEPEKRVLWVSGLVSSEPLGEGGYREVVEQAGLHVVVTATVERADEPHALDVRMRGRGVTARAESRLEERDGITQLTSSLDLRLGGLARLAGGVASRQTQRSLEQSLARLKALLEAA